MWLLTSEIAAESGLARGLKSGEQPREVLRVLPETEVEMFSVIILAAGASLRMGGVNKQLSEIGGVPVFVLSALKFDRCEKTAEIIIAAPEEFCGDYRELAERFGVKKLKSVVCGGRTRFESVKNALSAVDKSCGFIAVHDGARPLIDTADIERVFADAERFGAAIAACRAVDTVKVVDESGFIVNTPPRENLWYAQTPQAFRRDLFEHCAEKIGENEVTDDASVLELCGERVKITEISSCNMKITRPDDLAAARAVFGERNGR